MKNQLSFFEGKSVFLTGHTGFKGSWLSRILVNSGARVTGFSLPPPTTPSLYCLAKIDAQVNSVIGDIRDLDLLMESFCKAQPDIVIHMAAQPLVRPSYKDPHYTYETNVMGTVNILECIRRHQCVKSFLNVTTDKVYENKEWCWGYRENEPLNGFDPYSNSKSCSEIITQSYKNSFFSNSSIGISTARAGNVIGGGDFSLDRIIPDCIRAQQKGETVKIRNPKSTRPYQHVLEPLFAYLMIVQKQYEDAARFSGWYNVGPDDCDCVTTGELVEIFCKVWGQSASWESIAELNAPHEATFLKLDCMKLKTVFGWKPRWHIDEAIKKVCEWSKVWLSEGDVVAEMDRQIEEYLRS